jgi:peptide/nickel transport system ATP-binding protein
MNEPTKTELIRVNDLVVEYTADKNIVHAVNGVSFSVNKGETLGLVGETGAGKTTIAKAILRILPDPPAKIRSGSIELEGSNLFDLSEKAMRSIRGNRISMIFQDPMTALNPVYTVGFQIAEAIELHENLNSAQARQRAEQMLEMVGIPGERFSEYPHQFSGGMKQRVVIAMALACSPELLLADEPTTALDVTIQAQVLDMMDHLKKELGTSMILITHDLGIVAEMCDNVAVVYAGEVVEIGSAEEIFDRAAHPYTEGLFASLPSLTSGDRRLKPIPGMMPDPMNLPKGCAFSPRCPYVTDECGKGKIAQAYLGGSHYSRCIRAREATQNG